MLRRLRARVAEFVLRFRDSGSPIRARARFALAAPRETVREPAERRADPFQPVAVQEERRVLALTSHDGNSGEEEFRIDGGQR